MQPDERAMCAVASPSLVLTPRKPLPASFPLSSAAEPAIHCGLRLEVRCVTIRDMSGVEPLLLTVPSHRGPRRHLPLFLAGQLRQVTSGPKPLLRDTDKGSDGSR